MGFIKKVNDKVATLKKRFEGAGKTLTLERSQKCILRSSRKNRRILCSKGRILVIEFKILTEGDSAFLPSGTNFSVKSLDETAEVTISFDEIDNCD